MHYQPKPPTKPIMPLAIERLCRNFGITALVQIGVDPQLQILCDKDSTAWTVTVVFGTRTMDVPVFTNRRERQPHPASVLFMLLVWTQAAEKAGDVWKFAEEMALDSSKIETKLMFQHFMDFGPKLKKFLGNDFYAFQNSLG